MPITSSGARVVSPGRFSSAAASEEVDATCIAASSALKGAFSVLGGSSSPPRPRTSVTVHPPTSSTSSSAREPATI